MNWNLILGIAACLGLCMLALGVFYRWTYKAAFRTGYQGGYEQGRKVADNWWSQAESEVDAARVKIWREEAQR